MRIGWVIYKHFAFRNVDYERFCVYVLKFETNAEIGLDIISDITTWVFEITIILSVTASCFSVNTADKSVKNWIEKWVKFAEIRCRNMDASVAWIKYNPVTIKALRDLSNSKVCKEGAHILKVDI